MHGNEPPAREMFYGCDEDHLYVRLDGAADVSFGLEFENGPVRADAAVGRIVELRASRAGRRFRVTASRDGLLVATLPAEGWLDVPWFDFDTRRNS